jgi:hypothetical protein
MAAKLTRLTLKIAIQLHLVAESCTICSSCSRQLVRKLLDTPLYTSIEAFTAVVFQVKVLWFVTPCSIVVGYERFGVNTLP